MILSEYLEDLEKRKTNLEFQIKEDIINEVPEEIINKNYKRLELCKKSINEVNKKIQHLKTRKRK